MLLIPRPLILAALSLWSLVATGQVTIFPAAPKPDETVRVQLPLIDALLDAKVSMTNNRITVDLFVPSGDFATPPARPSLDLPIGRLPAGNYQVEVIRKSPGFPVLDRSLGTATFSVSPKSFSAPILDHTDMWWDPNESGWGLNLVQHPSGIIFATWFAYDPDGTPAWYSVSSGQWITPNPAGEPMAPTVYVGDIHRTTGPVVTENFDPSKVTRTLVGQLRLTFADRRWGGPVRAEFTVNGTTLIKNLQRFEF